MRAFILLVLLLLTGDSFAGDMTGKKVFNAVIGDDGIQRVEITGGSYFYDPDYIIVKKGVPVELIVRKKPGIVPHNIVVNEPEAGIVFDESMGTDQKVIRFTPGKAGIYYFYCDKKLLFFKSHRERGMEGIIEVVN